MRFKEWLISEDVIDSAGNFFYKLSLYPTDAFDGADAFIDPKDVWALQQRWRIEAKEGRKFHNLKEKEYINKKFATLQSLTMPGNSSKGWKNSKDDVHDLEVHLDDDMAYVGIKKKDSSPPNILPFKILDTYGLPLDNIFGDEVKERGDLSSNFDKPWKKVYENITPYDDVGPTRNINTHMGVASKYVGPDETGEKDKTGQEDMKVADFGFERPKSRHNRRQKHNPYILGQGSDSFRPYHHLVAP